MPRPLPAHDALSFICCQHYQRVDSTLPSLLSSPSLLSHYSTRLTANPIECPITAPKSFPFRFHCKTNVMSVAQLISPLFTSPSLHTSPDYSHSPIASLCSSNAFNEKGVDCVDACFGFHTTKFTVEMCSIYQINTKYLFAFRGEIDTNTPCLTYSPSFSCLSSQTSRIYVYLIRQCNSLSTHLKLNQFSTLNCHNKRIGSMLVVVAAHKDK